MKPWIQYIDRLGETSFMHLAEAEKHICDYRICGDSVKEFSVGVYDLNGSYVEFRFGPEEIGRIFACCFGMETDEFVQNNVKSHDELWSQIEVHELYYYGEDDDGLGVEQIQTILDKKNEESYFFRITEQTDSKFVLSFVFWHDTVSSEPLEWDEFEPN